LEQTAVKAGELSKEDTGKKLRAVLKKMWPRKKGRKAKDSNKNNALSI